MKILYIANIRLPTEKAHGVQIMKMCEAFSELGHEVELIVPWRFNPIHENPFNYFGIQKIFNIRKFFSLDFVRLGALGFLIQSFSFAIVAAGYTWKQHDAIAYTRDPLIAWLCALFGVRVIWEMHVASGSRAAKRAGSRVERVVVITQGLANFYKNSGVPAHKLLVAHDGVDIAEYETKSDKPHLRQELSLPLKPRIVAYVGKYKTMGQSKGVEMIIDAFGDVLKVRNDGHLLIVGLAQSEMDEVITRCDAAGVFDSNRTLLGHVPRSWVPLYLKSSDALVMSYPNTPHYARMMSPLKLFEYMASGVPIVTSDLPSIREVLSEEFAVLVPPDDKQALGGGMLRCLEESESQARATRARAEVERHYTWGARAVRVLQDL